MLDEEIIEPVSSERASPVVIVPKPHAMWRLCADYGKINAITVKVYCPLPRMDQRIDPLRDAQYFSKLD